MLEISDEEAMSVGFLGRDADGGAAGGIFRLVVDAKVNKSTRSGRIDADKARSSSGLKGFVLDEAVGRIFIREKVEGGKEVRCIIGVNEPVAAACDRAIKKRQYRKGEK